MRVLDLSVAALIGITSVATMAVCNPAPLEAQGRSYVEEASMREYLLSVVSNLTLPWLHSAGPGAVCESLADFSNSSIQVSAEGRGFLCSTGPPPGVPAVSIVLQFSEGNMTLRAWRAEGA